MSHPGSADGRDVESQNRPAEASASTATAPGAEPSLESVTLTVEDGVVLLTLGSDQEPIVTLSMRRMESLEVALERIEAEIGAGRVRGLVIRGSSRRVFCAGADLKLLHLMQSRDVRQLKEILGKSPRLTAEERALLNGLSPDKLSDLGRQLSRRGQRIFARLRALPIPTVAAIQGSCLGGGLELALHCKWIIAARPGSIFDDNATTTELGFPEPLLGLLQAWGGTELIPRRIGLRRALPFALQGKSVTSLHAKELGIVDAVVDPQDLDRMAISVARGDKKLAAHRLSGFDRFLTFTRLGRKVIADGLRIPGVGHLVMGARDGLNRFPRENYPAPHAILDVMLQGLVSGAEFGSDRAARRFGELMTSPQSQALVHVLFFGTEAAKARGRLPAANRDRLQCLVIGAGQMGAGIAHALARSGNPVTVYDSHPSALPVAQARIDDWIRGDRKLIREDREKLGPALRYERDLAAAAQGAQFVIEAVVEDQSIKKQVLNEVATLVPETTFIATNTSSIPIYRLATALSNPQRFFGQHYFNPVKEMRLVEIVRSEETGDDAVAFGAALAVAQGKYPIVVRDVPGFLINRILFPYLNEAVRMVLEGFPIASIDQAACKFGMVMGPLQTLDLVGLDIAREVAHVLTGAYPDRMQMPFISAPHGKKVAWDAVVKGFADRGMLGKKTGEGFYRYQGKKGRAVPNQRLASERFWEEIGGRLPIAARPDPQWIGERLILSLVNEAVRCLDEGVAGTPGPDAALQIDLGSVVGFGFAPFRGGILYFADREGARNIAQRLTALQQQCGDRFRPWEGIVKRSERGARFAQPAPT